MKIEVDNEWPIGYGILKLVGIYSHLTVIYKKTIYMEIYDQNFAVITKP